VSIRADGGDGATNGRGGTWQEKPSRKSTQMNANRGVLERIVIDRARTATQKMAVRHVSLFTMFLDAEDDSS